MRLDGLDVAGLIPAIQPGTSGEAIVRLWRGRYVLFANADGDYERGLRVALTVQPSDADHPRRTD